MAKNSIRRRGEKKAVGPIYVASALVFSAILLFSTFIIVYQTQQVQDLRGYSQTKNNCTVSEDKLTITNEEQKMFDLINEHRRQNNSQPLKLSPSLNRAATWMSTDMNSTKKLNHTDSLGRGTSTRLKDCGVNISGIKGENLGKGSATAQTILNAWKNSSGHNANMLNKSFKTIGIALVGTYWTTDYAASDDSGSAPIPVAPTTTLTPTSPPVPTRAITPTPTPTIPKPSSPYVPSPACLGSCPTPTITPGTALPSATSTPPVSQGASQPPINTSGIPSAIPTSNEPSATPQPIDIGQPNPEQPGILKGIIDFLIDLIKKLIEMLLALLGIRR